MDWDIMTLGIGQEPGLFFSFAFLLFFLFIFLCSRFGYGVCAGGSVFDDVSVFLDLAYKVGPTRDPAAAAWF